MSIRFFEGFELNYDIGPLSSSASDNVDGYWDFNSYFAYSSLFFNYPIVLRTDGTQALRLGTTAGGFGAAALSTSGGYPFSMDSARVGFEFRTTLPASEFNFFEMGRRGLTGERYVRITLNPDGTLKAYTLDDSTETLLGSCGTFSDNVFSRIEVFLSLSTGAVIISVDGIEELNTTMPTAGNASIQYGWPQPGVLNPGHLVDVDNVWSTDGEALVEGLNAVQVSASLDAYDAQLNAGLRGSLVFGDSQYQTDWSASGVSSSKSLFAHIRDKNVANTKNYIFTVNPNTGEAWDLSDIGTFQWGVCYFGTGEIRVDGICMSALIVEDGVPRIDYYEPGGLTFFSGPWRKSTPEKTYAAHVAGLPRPNILLRDDADSLYIDGEGCIFFDGVAQGSSSEDDPLVTIGVTFAEEFRADNRDWVRVDGEGFSYDSYFVAGYGVFGEGNKKFQNNYVTVNYENVPTGGAFIQGLWDYSFNADTGRWSMRQQIYHGDQDQTHKMRKLKIRGQGQALQIKVLSDGDKPFSINGWTLLITSNAAV